LLEKLDKARVPAGPIYNVEDMLNDPHFNARGLFETVEIDGKPLKIPALVPRMSRTPGGTRWPGGDLGSANQEVLGDLLGLDENQMSELRAAAVIL
jgi:crotonobetainyl-CoA:carnitine CoA-transferase CaiB-like acyl-CoA transferase